MFKFARGRIFGFKVLKIRDTQHTYDVLFTTTVLGEEKKNLEIFSPVSQFSLNT